MIVNLKRGREALIQTIAILMANKEKTKEGITNNGINSEFQFLKIDWNIRLQSIVGLKCGQDLCLQVFYLKKWKLYNGFFSNIIF